MNKKIVYNITKFTTTDYPKHLSCIIWLIKCNMRCMYCYNSDIVLSNEASYSFFDVLEFLKSRVGLLDGVVLSGGEATLHNLELYCSKIKELDFKIKLDTNGTNLKLIKKLIEKKLIDYVALDFKAPKEKFKSITQTSLYDDFIKTLEYLIKIDFDFEARTTIHSSLLDENDINSIIEILYEKGYKKSLFLQNFLYVEDSLSGIKEPTKLFDFSKLNTKLSTMCR